MKSLCSDVIDYLPRAAEHGDGLSCPTKRLSVILRVLFLSMGFPA